MIFPVATIDAIAAGDVRLAFRRWTAPRVKPGTRITNARGVVEIVSVEQVDVITDDDARLAGFDDAEALLSFVDKKSRTGGDLYRIEVRYAGADPRHALRADVDLSDDEVADLRKRLDRMDSAVDAPWTRRYLQLIADNPEIVSTTLAAEVGMPRPDFKLRVRRLKNLGLTESLEVGYRISPRGAALLGRLRRP